jgi:hypothetical protein
VRIDLVTAFRPGALSHILGAVQGIGADANRPAATVPVAAPGTATAAAALAR